ncbi:hypothetical protein [Rhizorhabdus wittichii]|uniref:hypothetical protein n=1 Tax=Rhizorhabdus wittichii TaxID=160791 RepID=UPI00178C5D62|nr:hypothetical protein [Rhizorhabdus wittichii]
MPDIKILVALTVLIIYLQWEFLSSYVNPKTGRCGTKFQIALPFFGFLTAAILVQSAVVLDTQPLSFILLGLGALALLSGATYGVLRRFRR